MRYWVDAVPCFEEGCMENYATAARLASDDVSGKGYWGEWYFSEMDEVTISECYTTDLVMKMWLA